MDGGRGQVNIAQQVLDELHLNIPVCGMVKDDNHRTRDFIFTMWSCRSTAILKPSS